MNRFLLQFMIALLSLFLMDSEICAQKADNPENNNSLAQLKKRLADINTELDTLAHYSLRSGIGSIGFRSDFHTTAEHTEWIEIELKQETTIDEIILIPAIRRATQAGFQADGFPAEFTVTVGTASNSPATVVATYNTIDGILPRIAPLVVPAKGINASWVRIEATRLTQRAFDLNYIFQLSEIIVFSGEENVALNQQVTTSSSHLERGGSSWNHRFLVDGHFPYLMDAAQGQQSIAYISACAQQAVFTLDLEKSLPLNRIHLHSLDQSDTVPQSYAGDLGIPQQLLIEGANKPDFSDAKILLKFKKRGINNTGPIMMWIIPETTCRYVRITGTLPESEPEAELFRIGFAEIELFSNGINVALGKKIGANITSLGNISNRPLASMTDGRNLYGNILTTREWLRQLARRHNLETERPIVLAELNSSYTRQKSNLNMMRWLAALLATAVAFTLFIDRTIRRRQIKQMRTRFAADLHDEVGADLHVISLLSDLAQSAVNSPKKLPLLHQRIKTMTQRASSAVRYASNMLEAEGLYSDLAADMQRTTERIIADFDHEFSVEGKEYLNKLKTRTRADLFLFYKECLINISRHSEATQVIAQLTATPKEIILNVSDNGHGTDSIPSSLKRRARLLRAKVTTTSSPSRGTCITLKLQTKRWRT